MNSVWNYIILNNTVRDWLITFSIVILSLAILRIIQSIIVNRIKKFTERTKSTLDDFVIFVIQSAVMPLLYVLAFYFALQYLTFPAKLQRVLSIAIMVVVAFYIIRILTAFIGFAFRQGMERHKGNASREKQAKGILIIIQVLVWSVGILFLIDNLGYDITTLVAGLGIGGIAIALAAQTILGDLFSYLVIFFDKPFEVGDFIIMDDKLGTVEYVGIKTTRIRTLNGEQLVCSNTDLTNSRVHNYKRMQERRIVFKFQIEYNTPKDKLKQIPQWIKRVIEATDRTRFDRAHLLAFEESGLVFEVVYIVLSPDYNIYMDIQQLINFQLLELFEKEDIRFARPVRIVYSQQHEEAGGDNTPRITDRPA